MIHPLLFVFTFSLLFFCLVSFISLFAAKYSYKTQYRKKMAAFKSLSGIALARNYEALSAMRPSALLMAAELMEGRTCVGEELRLAIGMRLAKARVIVSRILKSLSSPQKVERALAAFRARFLPKDSSTGPLLAAFRKERSRYVRVVIAESLVRCGAWEALPRLIEGSRASRETIWRGLSPFSLLRVKSSPTSSRTILPHRRRRAFSGF
jgi:hypothetical protein